MTTFVIHCEECKRVIEKNLREGPCPPEPENKPIDWSSPLYDGGYERRRFPYYDESLDLFIKSKQHKREVLKERNLIQHDGVYSMGGGNRKEKIGVVYSIPK